MSEKYEAYKRFFEKHNMLGDTYHFFEVFDEYQKTKSSDDLSMLDWQVSEMLGLSIDKISQEWLTEDEATEMNDTLFDLMFTIPEWVQYTSIIKKDHIEQKEADGD